MIQIHNKRGINSKSKIEVIQQQDIINLLKGNYIRVGTRAK